MFIPDPDPGCKKASDPGSATLVLVLEPLAKNAAVILLYREHLKS
jgi:hypothetical protein